MSRWLADAMIDMPIVAPITRTWKSAESSRSGIPVRRVSQIMKDANPNRNRRMKRVRRSNTNKPPNICWAWKDKLSAGVGTKLKGSTISLGSTSLSHGGSNPLNHSGFHWRAVKPSAHNTTIRAIAPNWARPRDRNIRNRSISTMPAHRINSGRNMNMSAIRLLCCPVNRSLRLRMAPR